METSQSAGAGFSVTAALRIGTVTVRAGLDEERLARRRVVERSQVVDDRGHLGVGQRRLEEHRHREVERQIVATVADDPRRVTDVGVAVLRLTGDASVLDAALAAMRDAAASILDPVIDEELEAYHRLRRRLLANRDR